MFSFLDLFFVKKELDGLVGSRFEKLFVGENFVLFQFSSDKKKFLKVVFGKAIFLAEKELSKDSFIQKPQFFKELEDYIYRFFLKDIRLQVGERIVKLIFELNGIEKTIEIGVFGQGEIKFNGKNRLNIGLNIVKTFKLKKESIKEELDKFNGTVEKFVSNYLGFGKFYSYEIKQRLKNKGKDFFSKETIELNNNEKEELIEELFNFINQPLRPFLGEKRPFPVEMITQKIIKKFKTYSEALDFYFKPKTKYEEKLEQLEKALKKQEEKIKKLEEERELLKKIGDSFFEYYEFFSHLKEMLQNKNEIVNLKEQLKQKGVVINEKEKYIEFDYNLLKKWEEKSKKET